MGGVESMEKINDQKASLFYDTIDSYDVFRGAVVKEDRSKMNAVFTIDDPLLEKEFLQMCEQEGMIGVKGHRTTGGFRVSMYNALPLESVQAITGLMRYFAQSKS